jgi:hypothetical protein
VFPLLQRGRSIFGSGGDEIVNLERVPKHTHRLEFTQRWRLGELADPRRSHVVPHRHHVPTGHRRSIVGDGLLLTVVDQEAPVLREVAGHIDLEAL